MLLRAFLLYWRSIQTAIEPQRQEAYLECLQLQEASAEQIGRFLLGGKGAAELRLERLKGDLMADERILFPHLVFVINNPAANPQKVLEVIKACGTLGLTLQMGVVCTGIGTNRGYLSLFWHQGIPIGPPNETPGITAEAALQEWVEKMAGWPSHAQYVISGRLEKKEENQ